jgi:hypothetical protein
MKFIAIPLIMTVVLLSCTEEKKKELKFESIVIDVQGKGRTTIGDMNMDGQNDIVVHTWGTDRGKVSDGVLAAYLYPDWKKLEIKTETNYFGDAVVISDINRDGLNDIITCRGNDLSAGVWWYENPGESSAVWNERQVAVVEEESETKDVEVHDMDGDGLQDVVVRTKHFTVIYFQSPDSEWQENRMETVQREGMTIGDVDNDGDYDIVLNGFWLENPEQPRDSEWKRFDIDQKWFTDSTGGWQDFSVQAVVTDMDGDGLNDVVFSHSEKPDYPVTWYGSDDPKSGADSWDKHEVDVVHYCHTLHTADFDMDGDMDIVAGTLSRLEETELVLFLNLDESATAWARILIDSFPVYKACVGDIDNDGDMDITSSYNWETPPLKLWRNLIVKSEE